MNPEELWTKSLRMEDLLEMLRGEVLHSEPLFISIFTKEGSSSRPKPIWSNASVDLYIYGSYESAKIPRVPRVAQARNEANAGPGGS